MTCPTCGVDYIMQSCPTCRGTGVSLVQNVLFNVKEKVTLHKVVHHVANRANNCLVVIGLIEVILRNYLEKEDVKC